MSLRYANPSGRCATRAHQNLQSAPGAAARCGSSLAAEILLVKSRTQLCVLEAMVEGKRGLADGAGQTAGEGAPPIMKGDTCSLSSP
jgi:hypothetical protein